MLRTRTILVASLLTSQALDLGTTYLGLGYGLREGNILASWLLSTVGNSSLLFVKMAVVVALLGIALKLETRYPKLWHGIAIASAITFMVAASNAVTIALAAV